MKSSAKKTYLTLLGVLIVAGLVSIAGMIPLGLKIKTDADRYKASTIKSDLLSKKIESLKALKDQYKANEDKLALAITAIPSDKSDAEFLAQIEGLLSKPVGPHPVKLNSISISGTPLSPDAKLAPVADRQYSQTYQGGEFYELPLTIVGSTDFVGLMTLIDRINQLGRITGISNINFNNTNTASPSFSITVSALIKPQRGGQ